jgi:hypothetical protein
MFTLVTLDNFRKGRKASFGLNRVGREGGVCVYGL